MHEIIKVDQTKASVNRMAH